MHQDLPPPVPSRETSGWAIASLVLGCGVIFTGCFTGIPAIVCGILGLRKIGKNPGMGGKGLSIAGIILGGFSLIFLPILAAIAIPAIGGALDKAKQVHELSDSHHLGIILKEYAENHDGKYPDSLEVLLTAEDQSADLKKLIYKEGTNEVRWILTPGLTTKSPGEAVLLRSVETYGSGIRKGNVGIRIDGNAEIMNGVPSE